MATPGMHAPPDEVPSVEGSASAATAPLHEARDATTTQGGHDAETAAKQSGAGPSSHGASSLEPITPADTPSERPDDTDFIQHPIQVAQLAEEQELEAEVRRIARPQRRRRRRSRSRSHVAKTMPTPH
ncbi:hypothetical protein LTS10_005908 [Elasticomyces elasticus]|nr:hypothetical protein LTS10_005908 [Elasticomyces elasticus]